MITLIMFFLIVFTKLSPLWIVLAILIDGYLIGIQREKY